MGQLGYMSVVDKGGKMTEIVPRGIPKGNKLVCEGKNIGATFEVGRSAFIKDRKVHCESDWKMMQAEKGVIQYQPIMGLGTLDEQINAMKYL